MRIKFTIIVRYSDYVIFQAKDAPLLLLYQLFIFLRLGLLLLHISVLLGDFIIFLYYIPTVVGNKFCRTYVK